MVINFDSGTTNLILEKKKGAILFVRNYAKGWFRK